MTSRERVRRAVHFEGPDRVPHFLPDGKENDLLWLWPERPPDIQPWTEENGIERRIDAWGITWERAAGEAAFGEAKGCPIKDITRQSEYVFPDCNNDRYYEKLAEIIRENNASPNPKYCLGVMGFESIFRGTHMLTGLTELMMAFYDHPEDVKALVGRLAEAQRESIRKLPGSAATASWASTTGDFRTD